MAGLALVCLAVLRTEWATHALLTAAARAATGVEDATVEAGSIRGSRLTSLVLTDFRIVLGDAGELATVDSLELRYSVRRLLRRRVLVRRMVLAGAAVDVRSCVVDPVIAARAGPADEPTSRPWVVTIDEVSIVGARATGGGCAPGEAWSITDLGVAASDIASGPSPEASIERVELAMTPGGASDGYVAALRFRGRLGGGALRVDTMTLTSPGSDVAASGTLRPLAASPGAPDFDFVLRADPVAFRDLQPFTDVLAPDASARLDMRLEGSGQSLDVDGSMTVDGGGEASIDAEVLAAQGSPLRYRGLAVLGALDPGVLFGALPGPIDGRVEWELEGTSAERLSGTSTVSVRWGAVGAVGGAGPSGASDASGDPGRAGASGGVDAVREVVGVEGDAVWTEGRAELNARLQTSTARLNLAGWATPLSPTRDLGLDGDFRWEAADSAGRRSVLAGRLAVEGSAVPDAPEGRVEVVLRDSELRGTAVGEGSILVELDGEVGTWRVAAAIGEGGLDASGGLGLGEAPTLRVDSARVRALDLESLGLAPWPTDLNGEASGTRTGAAEGLGDWTGDLSLSASTLGALVVDSVTARLALADGHFRADWSGRMLAGSIDGVVEGDLGETGAGDLGVGERDGTGVRGVARGAFRGLDPEATSGTRAGATALAGAYAAELDSRGVVAGGGSLSLTASRIRDLVVDTARIEVRVRGDSLDLSAEVDSRGGTLRVRGARAPGDAGPIWRVADARFVEVDLGALADSGGVATRLTGSIVGVVSGSSAGAATGEAQLRLEPSSVGSWSVDSLGVVTTLAEGRSLWTATIAGDDVSGTLSADVDVVDDPTRAGGTARFGGAVRGVQVDSALATFRYESGAVTADTLLVWSPWVTASGRAASSADSLSERRSEASLVVDLNGPTALRAWLGLEVDELAVGHVELAGSAVGDSVAARAELRGTALAYGSARIGELEAAGGGSWRPGRGPMGVAGVAEARALQLGQRPVERITVDAASEGEGVALTVDAEMDGTRRAGAGLWVRVVDGGATGTLRALDADLSGQVWRLDRPAELMAVDGFDVRDLSLSSPTGRISANGFVRPTGAQELVVSVDGLELAPVSDLLGYEGLRGRLDGSLDLTGTADSPVIVGSVQIVANLPETESATLDAETRYEGGVLDVDGSLALGGGGSARVLARLPYTVTLARADSVAQDDPPTAPVPPVGLVRGGPVTLDVRAERVALDWLSPWMPPETARDLVGTLDGIVIVGGTTEDLTLDGSIELVGAGGELPGLGLRLHEGSFSGRLDGDLLVIDRASVRSADGRLTTTGSLRADDLTAGELDLHVTLDDFQAVNTQMVRAVLDADLDIDGTTRAPIVTGAVDVLRGDVFLSDELAGARAEAVELTDADYAMLAEWFGYEPPADSAVARLTGPGPLAADVEVRLGRDVWIRQNASPKLSIQLTGDLRVQKESDELERVFGTLEAVPRGSYVEQFGRRFAITRGEVVFNGPPEELRLDVSSEYAVPSAGDPTSNEVVIGLGVIGGLEDMALVLSSEPEMENADIVSYLATGRPSSQTLQFDSEGDGLVERGADIALGQATDAVERLASESLGLDVVQIRTDGTRGVTVAAGRYVSPRLYLGFSRPISSRRSESSTATRTMEVEIEYQAFRWLLLNLRRDGSRLDFFLRSRHAY